MIIHNKKHKVFIGIGVAHGNKGVTSVVVETPTTVEPTKRGRNRTITAQRTTRAIK
jgi:hypothetical protein